MTVDWDDDEQLIAELGDAVRAARAVPDRFVEAGRAAFTWHTVDAELAALTFDSELAGASAADGVRAGSAPPRSLTFVAGELTIEVELAAGELTGQLVPPQPGEVALSRKDGSTVATTADDVGWFTLGPVPPGLVRLQIRTAGGHVVHTEWTTL